MSFRKFAPLCYIGKVSKNIQIWYKFSQILTNELQILTVNPNAASIYGFVRKKKWRLTPPGWLAETSQMIPYSPKRNASCTGGIACRRRTYSCKLNWDQYTRVEV
jgi:hypothetical protein